MIVFKVIYWLGLIIEIIIRAPYQKTAKSGVKAEQRVSITEKGVLGLLTLTGLFLPLVYSLTNWLDFANYHLPLWMGWLGGLFLVGALFVFYRAHLDLKSNWSPTLEIRQDHTLITNGIYHYIRHPMYASQALLVIAQTLLLQNWLAGPAAVIVFLVFYFLRVQGEEKMMLETFGDQYRLYMQHVGGLIPKMSTWRE